MSRILKSGYVSVNPEERVQIEIYDYYTPPLEEEPETDDESVEVQITQEEVLAIARLEAEQIVATARSHAKEILDSSRKQAEIIANGIFENAQADGYEKGYNKGVLEAEAVKEEAQEVYNDTLAEREQTIAAFEPEIVSLVIAILDKLVPDVIAMNPQVILALIRQGVSGANLMGDISIHVSDEDYDFVVENKAEIMDLFSSSTPVQFVRDVGLKKSDCMIETGIGNIDCCLDRQFAELRKNLYYILENR